MTDDVLPVTGTVADNGFSNDATLTIAGTAEAGSTVTLYDTDGTTVLGTGVASGGAFSITTTALGQGSHTITAKATDTAGNQGAASTAYHVTIDTSAPAETLAITSIAGSSSPNVTTITVSGSNGALVNGDKVQISGDDGVTWTDVVQNTATSWSFADNVTRTANFTYRTRIIDIAGNVGVTVTQPVLVANNGGTISVGASSALVAKFTGTAGGTLQLGPSPGITGTVNAISIASGLVVISGNASVTSGTGDAIDLTATGGTQAAPANLSINLTGPITGAASGIAAVQNAYGSITVTTSGPVIGQPAAASTPRKAQPGLATSWSTDREMSPAPAPAFSGIVAQNLNTANNGDVTVVKPEMSAAAATASARKRTATGTSPSPPGRTRRSRESLLYGIEAFSNGQGNITVTTASGDFDQLRQRRHQRLQPGDVDPASRRTDQQFHFGHGQRHHQFRHDIHRRRRPTGRNSGGIQGRHDEYVELHGVRQRDRRQFCEHQRSGRRRYPGVQFWPRRRHDCQPCDHRRPRLLRHRWFELRQW